MSEPARRAPTYQDVLNAPPEMVAEIIEGELHLHPRPAPRHAFSSTVIPSVLYPYNRRRGGPAGPGGWLILIEPELHLGDEILVPDVAGWRRARMPDLPETAFIEQSPDWICEVLSPSTVKIDRSLKKRSYARNRVQHLWLVDPLVRSLEVLELAGEFWREVAVFSAHDKVRAVPFEELEIALAEWWDEDAADAGGGG